MIKKILSSNAPSPGKSPHSQAIVAGSFVFTQGVICLTPSGEMLDGPVEAQIHQIMANLQAILAAADLTFSDVVKTTIFVTDMAIYSQVNEVYAKYMSEPYPARETVCVKELPLGAKAEISMIAFKG